jgi:hypothetical protein
MSFVTGMKVQGKGAGTQGEITIAKFLNKPIYLVSNFDFEEIPSLDNWMC